MSVSEEGAAEQSLDQSPESTIAQASESTVSEPHETESAANKIGSINDGLTTRQGYVVSLDYFEGPLDLLLHLVRRHELDILEIPIAFIAQKYNEYLNFFRSLDIEIVGEYLVMAATLAFLKSRELLPPEPSDEEGDESQFEDGEDPKENLIRRLIEYERFKLAGDELDARPVVGRDVFSRGRACDVIPLESGLAPLTLFRLAEAYNRVLDRAKILKTHEVKLEAISVRERMRQMSDLLCRQQRFSFEEIFLERTWSSVPELRRYLVVTLMSVLELVKLGVLGIEQDQAIDSLVMERVIEIEEMRRIIGSFHDESEDVIENSSFSEGVAKEPEKIPEQEQPVAFASKTSEDSTREDSPIEALEASIKDNYLFDSKKTPEHGSSERDSQHEPMGQSETIVHPEKLELHESIRMDHDEVDVAEQVMPEDSTKSS